MKERLIEIVESNLELMKVFNALETMNINYYIGAGAIVQSVWNTLSNKDINHGISDIDIIFYDHNLSKTLETEIRNDILDQLDECSIWLDVKNQARVHLWYKDKFGYDIEPYLSLESAIDTWPTTATALGLRKVNNVWEIYAPYGLEDLFGMIVRANPLQITEEIYLNKVMKWQKKWQLNIIPFDSKILEISNKIERVNLYKLEKVITGDKERIYDIKKNSIKHFVSEIWGWDEQYQLLKFEKSFNTDNLCLITQDETIGYMEIHKKELGINLSEIHLVKAYQNKGIGSKIIEDLKKAYNHITLGCFKLNTRAKAFYIKNDFDLIGQTRTHYLFEYIEPHEKVYRKLQAAGHGGWGGSNYENRMIGWDEHLPIILKEIQLDTGSVLELGSGAGDVCFKLHDMGFRCTGIEISETAVKWSKEKAGDRDVEFLSGDVCNPKILKDRKFDLVLDANCLHCLLDEDREMFYRNVKRLLNKDGYFVVSSVILKNAGDKTPTVSPIGRCVLSEDVIVKEVKEHFSLINYYIKKHENHNHFWGFCKLL